MDKPTKQKLVDQSVNIFLYNLKMFEEFKNIEPKRLNVKCDTLKSDDKCLLISIETPETPQGVYLHFISQNTEAGLTNFMINSCKHYNNEGK